MLSEQRFLKLEGKSCEATTNTLQLHIENLIWNCFGLHINGMKEEEDRDVWRSILSCCSCNPHGLERQVMGNVCLLLFQLDPPVTRKRRWRYILDESAPALSCPFSSFPGCFFDFLLLNLLLVRSHQAEIIIVNRLI